MIFLLDKIYHSLGVLFLDYKVRNNQPEKAIYLELSSYAKVINWPPALVRPFSLANNPDVDSFSNPSKNEFVSVRDLNMNIRQFCDMSLTINQARYVSNLYVRDIRCIKRNVTFERFGLKGISTRMGTILSFAASCFARMEKKHLATAETGALDFWLSVGNLRELCVTASRARFATQELTGPILLKAFAALRAFFPGFHKSSYTSR